MATSSTLVLKTLFAISVGLIGIVGWEMKKSAEPSAPAITDYAKAHRVIVPHELEQVPLGIYSGIDVSTPAGTESCKASITQDGYSSARQAVLSDCVPK